jgi:HD-GYP domain-containing protein (c-di-GMP phosphodiesterase class II)
MTVADRFPSASMEDTASLSQHLHSLHERILQTAPGINRIGCALYDPGEGMLKTFINSTREGEPLSRYQYPLASSASLSAMARSRATRRLDNLPQDLNPDSEHSKWVLNMGYRSSFTTPLYYQDQLLAFLFFDSKESDYFTPEVQRELLLYAQVITMAIANELVALRSIMGAVSLAKDFAELRDLETGAHLERMARYSRLLAQTIAEDRGITDEFVENLFIYAPLHDIGKIGIPDRVLLKPGPLDADEWEVMKTHTTKGRRMVDSISEDLDLTTESANRIMRNIVELHHEALDGSGYPHGLKGDAIPLESRIITVADIFDALTTVRPYKEAWPADQALAELNRMVHGGKLDPDIVAALERNLEQAILVRDTYLEEKATRST